MNEALINVIKDLEKQLEACNNDIDWHHKQLKEENEKALNLKETIVELKAMKTVMA